MGKAVREQPLRDGGQFLPEALSFPSRVNSSGSGKRSLLLQNNRDCVQPASYCAEEYPVRVLLLCLHRDDDGDVHDHGDVGDACVKIDGLEQKVSPTSTVIGAMMLNSIVAAVAQKLVDSGMKKPPIFYSANLDGGDALNQKLYEEYKESIHYQF